MKLSFYQTLKADVVIAGAGYAGIKAAYECSKAGLNVLLTVRSKVCSGSSFYPLMMACGCLSPKDEADKELFVDELCEVGLGINDKKMSETFVENIAERVTELESMGFPISKLYGRKACFALRDRDIFKWEDFSGIKKTVRTNFSKIPNLTIMEQSDLVHIISQDKKVTGAIIADKASRLCFIKTNNVILATGGFCSLYKNNTNTEDTLGLGQAMAYDAGARLINLEFVQFIPCFITPTYNAIVPETSLLFADRLQDTGGKELLSQYLPSGITPRQCIDSRSGHGPFTSVDYSKFFDIATVKEIQRTGKQDAVEIVFSPDILDSDNPAIQLQVKNMRKLGIDPVNDRLTLALFGNSSNGGVFIDKNAQTDVEGLFAAGEVSGGLHGADRVGGLASGSCFVFGKKAADSAAKRCAVKGGFADETYALHSFTDMLYKNSSGSASSKEVISNIKDIIDKSAGIIRTQDGLAKGIESIKALAENYSAGRAVENGESLPAAAAARHALKTAELILTCMAERKESRGAHYREDYPHIDNDNYSVRIAVSNENGHAKLNRI